MTSIYLDTSIIGYLTARSPADVIFQARQKLTQRWWERGRGDFDVYVSQFVLDEASAGDSAAAAERLQLLDGIELLDIALPEVDRLAAALLERHLLPVKAATDARHVAVAAVYAVDYLMTWNCKHIANAVKLPSIYLTIRDEGFEPPLIVTPEEFSGYDEGPL